MKRKSKSILLAGLILAIVSCDEMGDIDDSMLNPDLDSFESQFIDVAVEATAEAFGDADFSWQADDEIALLYKREGVNEYIAPKFQYVDSNKFSGKLWSWEEAISLYAIYNRGEDISTLNFDGGSIEVSRDMLSSVDLSFESSSLSAREVGLMAAKVDNAMAESELAYSIPTLEFRQVASMFQLIFVDGLEDAIVESLSLRPTSGDDTHFVDNAKVSISEGDIAITGIDRVVAIESEVAGGDNTAGKYLSLPLFPVNIAEDLTLSFVVNGVGAKDGWSWRYSYNIDGGADLKPNEIFSLGELSWSDDLQKIVITSPDPGPDPDPDDNIGAVGEDADVVTM